MAASLAGSVSLAQPSSVTRISAARAWKCPRVPVQSRRLARGICIHPRQSQKAGLTGAVAALGSRWGGGIRREIVEEDNQTIAIMWPQSFEEVPQAIIALREGSTVVMNLSGITSFEEQQRCVDFVAGGCYAMSGQQETLSESVFLFLPNGVTAASASSRREALLSLGSANLGNMES